MLKKYLNILLFFILLLTPIYTRAQIYIEGYGGVNTLTLTHSYNFTGNIGFGYNNKKVKIGVESGIGIGCGYPYSDESSIGGVSVSFTDYVDDKIYKMPKRIISNTGNIYPTIKNNITFSNQFSFGLNTEWFIINSFTDKLQWFDVGVFSGIGFSHHHTSDTSIFQPYVKAGIEMNFNITKDVTFLVNGDIRYYVALNGINNQTNAYHSFLQQTVNIGIRYTIPIPNAVKKSNNQKQENMNNNVICVNVYDVKDIEKDTTIIMLPTAVFFANNRYDIRKTEINKLNKVSEFIKKNNSRIRLIGMASNIGSHTHNKKLSLKRCETVFNYLVENGVPPEKIKIEATGDNNAEINEEALDRCVIIIFE